MDKKKVIKIAGIIIVIVIVSFLFLFRVTICNSIERAKIKSAVKSQYTKPDYQIEFINNIEVHPDGNGYSRNFDELLIFLNENKIVYSDAANKKNKISFILGNEQYYLKTKVINLENSILENVQKYETNKFLLTPEKLLNLKEEIGDIRISNIKYSGSNVQEIKTYCIPKSNNTELYNILKQIKK